MKVLINNIRKDLIIIESILKLTSPIPPSVNHYMAVRGVLKYKNGKPIPMGLMYETQLAKKYKKDFTKYVTDECKKQNWINPKDNSFYIIEVVAYFPRIDMDVNNYWKCLVDAITDTKLLWDDDNIVLERANRIYYDSDNPRFEITIYTAPYIGIFDNSNDYNNFINTYCNKCKKGSKIGQKGGCSIYKNALESRIQNDLIIDFSTQSKKCLKFKEK